MKDSFKAIAAALLFAALSLLFPAQAFAQATRTWVSGVGDDVNPCSRTAPCKTFAGAISKTAAGGEINVLDPGGFGAVTITKSITIRSDSIEAGVLVAGGVNGIIVNALSTDKVLLEGLDIEGLGATSGAPGLNGIHILGGGKVTVRKCSIRNFSQNGINVVGTTGSRVFVEDTQILNNGGGLNLQTTVAGNGAVLRNSTVDSNTSFATQITGGTLILIGSTLTGGAGIVASGGAAVISYGNNVIRGGGAPTQTVPLQ
jgi:hypothetical protein